MLYFARGTSNEGIHDLRAWSGPVLRISALVGKSCVPKVGVALACLILSSPQILFAKEPTEPAQLWSTDLSNDADFVKRARAENSILLRPPTLDFLDNEHIIVAFDDNSRSLSGLEMRPFGFH